MNTKNVLKSSLFGSKILVAILMSLFYNISNQNQSKLKSIMKTLRDDAVFLQMRHFLFTSTKHP